MSYIDHHDVFFGSADNGRTFVVVNAQVPDADRILTNSGFTAHEQHGRTWYLLPPDTARQDADQATALAFMGLLAKTMDIADLTSTADQEAVADVYFDLTRERVVASSRSAAIHDVLKEHGFLPAPVGHVLPPETTEAEAIAAVVRAESHLYTTGARIHINLGIRASETTAPARRPAAVPRATTSATDMAPRRAR